ncbi:MAG TPA: enoyl-CoA hydratase-related protein [Pseudomonadales bacterium]|jgi:2-(1,2-epoxy-1,2-dihydrophenyl)acetyl-CoA isomerase|nr:enoyl-CoA hydratase [Gammaproteobacteria bacterium]MDP6027340.1 enoyl-CoA hydratase-related protein [Pseudomonadales bacterium]MBP17938.1 enoyl-CoA hydratase [Gammaproteobacteria bacterium]MDP6317025.1 enoyl-CoA hydratase-related protein [Pseudomonadales bacterium]MDP7316200.1 enoyl-CoA hydratase-related protein [Pseudomonadales bacterium]|tara:strand:+ start:7667 stop:8443 length:777 start_codon:yes stop_codon:yes gene_type:complete
MSYETILFEKKDPVAIITLHRPERLNAWTTQMNEEIVDAVGQANNDDNVGAIVVTGAGRGFCSGADIQDNFQAGIDSGPGKLRREPSNWVNFMRQSKPIVAAVNGVAVGVGATLMLSFDVIIASDTARFGFAFVKMGVVPELASSHFLVQRIGFSHASEMCLTGRLYSASEVHEKGLTNYVVPADELMSKAMEIALEIANNPSRQLGMIKTLLTENGSETNIDQVQMREGKALAECYVSPEHKEAVQAFIEKRPPSFR